MDIFKVARQYHQKLAQEESEDRRDTIPAPSGTFGPSSLMHELEQEEEEFFQDQFDELVREVSLKNSLEDSFEEEAPDTERQVTLTLTQEEITTIAYLIQHALNPDSKMGGEMLQERAQELYKKLYG
jgi:predicted transcriptional regulator